MASGNAGGCGCFLFSFSQFFASSMGWQKKKEKKREMLGTLGNHYALTGNY